MGQPFLTPVPQLSCFKRWCHKAMQIALQGTASNAIQDAPVCPLCNTITAAHHQLWFASQAGLGVHEQAQLLLTSYQSLSRLPMLISGSGHKEVWKCTEPPRWMRMGCLPSNDALHQSSSNSQQVPRNQQ